MISILARWASLAALVLAALACAGRGSPGPDVSGSGGTPGNQAGSGAGESGGGGSGGGGLLDAGGTAGTAANPGADAAAGAGGSAPRGCAMLPLCDDFETAPVGGKPDTTRWTVGAPDVTGTGTLAIDDAQHHSGAHSVKVSGQGGYSNHIFLTNSAVIGTLGPIIWGRFYVRFSDALGDGHLTFLSMKDTADGGKHLRMGGQAKILMWNRESDDATVPALSPVGIAKSLAPPTNQWLCVELMIDRAQGFLQTWVDGTEIAGVHIDDAPTPDVDEQWLRKPNWRPVLTDFALGWEAYAGQAMTVWFDDVALDAARLGCL